MRVVGGHLGTLSAAQNDRAIVIAGKRPPQNRAVLVAQVFRFLINPAGGTLAREVSIARIINLHANCSATIIGYCFSDTREKWIIARSKWKLLPADLSAPMPRLDAPNSELMDCRTSQVLTIVGASV